MKVLLHRNNKCRPCLDNRGKVFHSNYIFRASSPLCVLRCLRCTASPGGFVFPWVNKNMCLSCPAVQRCVGGKTGRGSCLIQLQPNIQVRLYSIRKSIFHRVGGTAEVRQEFLFYRPIKLSLL